MRRKGVLQVETEVVVPFFDVDLMEVVWHGHYVKYLEVGRCALLDRLDYNYRQMSASGYAWPVIDMQLRYVGGARLGQRLTITADLVEWEHRLRINYLIRCAATGTRLTRATTVQVAVDMASGEMLLASPQPLLQAVERALQS